MSRQDELRYIYQTRRNQMDKKMLFEYIDLLESSYDKLMETMEDIAHNEEKEPFSNFKEDMD